MKNQGIYSGLCETCNKVKTTSKDDDGTFECVCCGNDRYYKDLRNGNRIELKVYLPHYSQGTLEELIMVLAKNKLPTPMPRGENE